MVSILLRHQPLLLLSSSDVLILCGRKSVGRRKVADRLGLVYHIVDVLRCHNKT
jgi:hypothetical protein